MGIQELLASWGFVVVLVQPIGNLGVIPPFLPEITNGVVEGLLLTPPKLAHRYSE